MAQRNTASLKGENSKIRIENMNPGRIIANDVFQIEMEAPNGKVWTLNVIVDPNNKTMTLSEMEGYRIVEEGQLQVNWD